MKLGIIGYGEAAYELSIGLKKEGLSEIHVYDVMQNDIVFGPLINERVGKSKVYLEKSLNDIMNKVDCIFITVPADRSLEVCNSICEDLKEGMLYVDLTASTPSKKQNIWEIIKVKNILFADGAMLGALPMYGSKVPILASGNGVDKFIEWMSPYNMNITKVSDKPGDASAIKLIRSIYMKGIAGLLIETLESACTFGVEDQVISSLSNTMDSKSFIDTVNRLLTGTAIHAQRRKIELLGSIEMLEEAGLDADISRAAVKKHEKIADLKLRESMGGRVLQDWREVIEILIDKQ